MTGLAIIAAVLYLDQMTKYIVASHEAYWGIEVIHNFFYITYAKNEGMAWSLLSGQQVFLSITAAAAIGGMLWYLTTQKPDKLTRIGLYLMIGGAAGNLIDRLMLNYVRDFLDFYIFGYNFPVFNIADSALCIGVALLLLASFTEGDKTEHAA